MISKRGAMTRLRRTMSGRRSTSPYLSGDVFRSMADISIASREDIRVWVSMEPAKKNSRRIIFVRGHLLRELFDVLSQEEAGTPRVILSGNSDANFSDPIPSPEGVVCSLVQNLDVSATPGLRLLPIGIENRRNGRYWLSTFKRATRSIETKANKLLVPPYSATHEMRSTEALRALRGRPFCVVDQRYRREHDYFHLVSRFRFVLCLPGNGLDTHRVWESLYLGSIPVVPRSAWSLNLANLGLPVVLFDHLFNVEDAIDVASQHLPTAVQARDLPQLWAPFWDNLIKQHMG